MDVPVHYRIKDPIQNFRARVTVRCVVEAPSKGRHKARRARGKDGELLGPAGDRDRDRDEDERRGGDSADDSASDDEGGSGRAQRQGVAMGPKQFTESFTWQEKVFGPRELVRYLEQEEEEQARDVAVNRTAIEAEYREQIRRRQRYGEDLLQDVSRVMLFSYTDKDGFVPKNELTKFVTTSESFELNGVAESIVRIPETGGHSGVGTSALDAENAGDGANDADGQAGDQRSGGGRGAASSSSSAGQRLFRESPFKVFYLMAAVDVDPSIKLHKHKRFYEVVLCTVKVSREGDVVEMQPAFSSATTFATPCASALPPAGAGAGAGVGEGGGPDHARWYRFKTPQGSVYEYALVNEAESLDPMLETEINSIQRETTERVYADLEGRVSNMLFGGPQRAHSVVHYVYLEVVAALDFCDAASDNLYVQYEVHLPANGRWSWTTAPQGQEQGQGQGQEHGHANLFQQPLMGMTQTTKCRHIKGQLRAHYCFPVELKFRCDSAGDAVPMLHDAPTLYLQVKSRDMWERHRTEGYASMPLRTRPGSETRELPSWKVAGSLRQQAAEHFVGGALQLDSATYAALPQAQTQAHSQPGPFLNRYGFASKTAGSVRVRTNTILHRHVNPIVTAKLDAADKKTRRFGTQHQQATAADGAPSASSSSSSSSSSSTTRRRTVTEILNSLKLGKSKPTAADGSSSDLMEAFRKSSS